MLAVDRIIYEQAGDAARALAKNNSFEKSRRRIQ
jgi:hypothetical protein